MPESPNPHLRMFSVLTRLLEAQQKIPGTNIYGKKLRHVRHARDHDQNLIHFSWAMPTLQHTQYNTFIPEEQRHLR